MTGWDGAWFAPGRINLIGEHTDYNDGFVLPFALPQRTVVRATPTHTPQWIVYSETLGEQVTFGPDDLEPGRVTGWAGYVAAVVWALTEDGHVVPGARLSIDSDVPVGAGLSSSAALECAVLTALCDLGDLEVPIDRRPRLAQRAENVYVGVPCGIMDQTAPRSVHLATRCSWTAGLSRRSRSRSIRARPGWPFSSSTPARRTSTATTSTPQRRRAARLPPELSASRRYATSTDLPAALAALPDEVARRRVRHVVTENHRVRDVVALLRAGRLADTGPILTASHASMRDDFEITVPETDTAVDAALAAGAHGARMTGGGFGGCVIALVDENRVDAVAVAVKDAFAAKGFAAPDTFTAVPSAAAGRL